MMISRRRARGYFPRQANWQREYGIAVTTKIIENFRSPVWAITKFADEGKFDLTVVGTRGMGGLKKAFLGSVANGIVHYANNSVLVTR